MPGDDYESELTGSREDLAAVLGGVADGLLAGSIRLGDGADALAVDPPGELSLEIELETDDEDVSLELELEWPADADAAAVEPLDATSEAAGEAHEGGEADDAEAEQVPELPVGAAAPLESLARFEVFRDRGDEWRWRLRHRNGNVVATSGEGYTRKHNAWKGLRSVMRNAPEADVTESSTD